MQWKLLFCILLTLENDLWAVGNIVPLWLCASTLITNYLFIYLMKMLGKEAKIGIFLKAFCYLHLLEN